MQRYVGPERLTTGYCGSISSGDMYIGPTPGTFDIETGQVLPLKHNVCPNPIGRAAEQIFKKSPEKNNQQKIPSDIVLRQNL
jgi:hypothetical protein